MIAMDNLTVLQGRLPPRAHGLVIEWAAARRMDPMGRTPGWTEFAAKIYPGKTARPSLNIAAILSVDWVHLNGLPGRLGKGVAVSY